MIVFGTLITGYVYMVVKDLKNWYQWYNPRKEWKFTEIMLVFWTVEFYILAVLIARQII